MVEKFTKETGNGPKVAVLYSPGFGAGWSTWGETKCKEFMIFAKPLVELALAGNTKDDSAVATVFEAAGLDIPYLSGWEEIQVTWLPVGTKFQIHEYDGSETIILASKQVWLEA